jgi:hypothetical protein
LKDTIQASIQAFEHSEIDWFTNSLRQLKGKNSYNTADPKPNSDNPKFIEKWLNDINKKFPDYKLISKNWEEGKKSSDTTGNSL